MKTKLNLINTCTFLLVMWIIPSCNRSYDKQTHQNNVFVIEVNNLPLIPEVKLSDISQEQLFIDLITPKDLLIGGIDEIIINDNFMLILDRKHSNRIYKFSRTGQLIRTIGSSGKGPGEYLRADDISIDNTNQLLYVLSRQDREVNVFSINNGNHIADYKLDFAADEIEIINEQKIAVFNHATPNFSNRFEELKYKVLITNTSFDKIFTKLFPMNAIEGIGKTVYFAGRYFINDGTNLYLSWRFNDTIYRFEDDLFLPLIYFDFGNKRVTYTSFEESGADFIIPKLIDGSFHSLNKPAVFAGSTLITQFIAVRDKSIALEEQIYFLLLNTITKQSIVTNKIVDDINNSIFNFPVGAYESFLISTFLPEDLINTIDPSADEYYFPGTGSTLKRYGNPVLVFTQFKL